MATTEALLQNEIFTHCDRRGHRYMLPNTTIFGWESDMVSVTAAGYICEYEIKCSRSDFRADMKKSRHRNLNSPNRVRLTLHKLPAYFYYVAPRGLLKLVDIPEYAGLMSVERFCMMEIEKKAPKLHREPMTEHQRQWFERGLTVRYWQLRKKHE